MNRHRTYFGLDDQPLIGGDGVFLGVNMRLDPTQLQEGYVSNARNKRFIDGVAKTRKGIRKLSWSNPVTVTEADREAGKIFPYGPIYGAGVFKDPDDREWVIVVSETATGDKVWRCRHGSAAVQVPVPAGFTVTSRRVNFIQCFSTFLMQRGEGQSTLVMTDVNVGFVPITPPAVLPAAGASTIPNSDNAIFFQNRVFVPYNRDIVWVSLALEYTHGWSTLDEFRINQGSEDKLVALYKFNDETLIAAKERSIYVVTGIRGEDDTGADADHIGFITSPILDSITTEYGCKAKRSFVQVGKDVWFLADRRGICSIAQTEQNKLHAVDVPVSRDIEPLIKRINWIAAEDSVSSFWDNKVYFAVPIDGSNTNNAVLVYDTINGAWSGYDFGAAIDVKDFIRFSYQNETRLGFLDNSGFISLYEHGAFDEVGDDYDGGWSSTGVITRTSVQDYLLTRGYLCNTPAWKRFRIGRWSASTWWPSYSVAVLQDGFAESTSLGTITKDRTKYYKPFDKADYDTTNVNDDWGDPDRQDYSIDTSGQMNADPPPATGLGSDTHQEARESRRLNVNGRYCQLAFTGTQGRTELRSCGVEATESNRRLGTES